MVSLWPITRGMVRAWKFSCSLLFIAVALLPSRAQNLVSNPGFESGTNDWASSSSTSFTVTGGAHSGAACAILSGSFPTLGQVITGGLRPGQTYRWSAWMRSSPAVPPPPRNQALILNYTDASGDYAMPVAFHTLTTTWTEVSAAFDFAATGAVSNARISFQTGPGTLPNYSFYLDDVSLINTSPKLAIERTNGSVIVSWPTNATGDSLQRKLDLLLPVSWTTVTNAVQTNGDVFSVVIPATSPFRAFRLRR